VDAGVDALRADEVAVIDLGLGTISTDDLEAVRAHPLPQPAGRDDGLL
jgi:hypothetical protein